MKHCSESPEGDTHAALNLQKCSHEQTLSQSEHFPISLWDVAYCCFGQINSKVSVPEPFLINSVFFSPAPTYNAVHQKSIICHNWIQYTLMHHIIINSSWLLQLKTKDMHWQQQCLRCLWCSITFTQVPVILGEPKTGSYSQSFLSSKIVELKDFNRFQFCQQFLDVFILLLQPTAQPE